MERSENLVKRAKEGEIAAFAALYEEIYKDLYRFALYTLRNRQDAEDAVSETVTDAFASIGKLRREDAFRAWMFRILSNKCKNRLKEYTRKYVELEDAEEELAHTEEVTESVYIQKIFGELEETDRFIISLHVFGGYTNREIASILSMNANTVRTRESRALKKMAARMQDEGFAAGM